MDTQDVLVSSGRDLNGVSSRERLAYLLGQLAAGPTRGERDAQLDTALPPEVKLSVADVRGRTVTVDLHGTGQAPSGRQSRRAVGQIVLTATSVPGIKAVRLTRSGDPVEAPLPSGELTSTPLTATDYRPLLLAPPS